MPYWLVDGKDRSSVLIAEFTGGYRRSTMWLAMVCGAAAIRRCLSVLEPWHDSVGLLRIEPPGIDRRLIFLSCWISWMNKQPGLFTIEVRDARCAKRMLTSEHEHSVKNVGAATQSVAAKIGCSAEPSENGLSKIEVDSG